MPNATHIHRFPLIAVLSLAACDPMDRVAVTNPPTDPERVGLLVDGTRNGHHVNDEPYTPKLPPQGVPNLEGQGEVVAFAKHRAVAIEPANWTPAAEDRVEVELAQRYALPITVWLVDGDPAEQKERMHHALTQTNAIWATERAGIRIASMQFLDRTTKATAELLDFDCTERKTLSQTIGRKPDRINLYLVDRVDGHHARVATCGGDGFAVLADGVFPDDVTFALTANFGLRDVGQYGKAYAFNEENVMHPDHGPRKYLTEGQVFRMHVNPKSALNTVYGVRKGMVVRKCGGPKGTVGCPRVDRRLWADGALRTN